VTGPAATSPAVHEHVEPVFFTGRAARLYGCHHVAVGSSSQSAVVLCAPAGHEYILCHRTLRQLAAQLAKAGHHAFRFDYSGTGDSGGDYADASLRTWQTDVSDAIDECKRRSGAAVVGLIGLRLGAALALHAAAGRNDVRSVVMWNPVVDGAAMLREWRAAQRAFEAAGGHARDAVDDEVLGMPLTGALASEMERLDESVEAGSLARMLVCHGDAGQADVARLVSSLSGRVRTLDVQFIEQPPIWRQEPLDAIVPFQALRAIVDWMRVPT
jgi:uncharacterized protein